MLGDLPGRLAWVALGITAEPTRRPADGHLIRRLSARLLSRVLPDGAIETVAEIPGGPNGAAIGPDGAVYVCNNGGWLQFVEVNGVRTMGPPDWSAYIGGRIQRVDPDRGTVTDLYTQCDGRPLRSPNDLVMDGHGGLRTTAEHRACGCKRETTCPSLMVSS